MYQEPPNIDNRKTMPASWRSIPGGERAQIQLQRQLNHFLPEFFGYYGLALGALSSELSYSRSPVKHWFKVGRDARFADIQAGFEALPIASDSVDVVICTHALEFLTEPHQVLRELERVIIPDGHLVLSGINPWSWYGSRHYSCRLMKKECREKRLIGLSRLKDWLLLLGFSVEVYSGLGLKYHPENHTIYRSVASHFTSHYFIIAKKCVSTITPLRPSWRDNRKLVPARFAEPGVRRLVERELKKVQN